METYNREELYVAVWEQPLVKVALKYGVSAVMLGKVCQKLQVPLPGRGYWTKKEFGKPVERVPLPEAKDLPVVMRVKEISTPGAGQGEQASPKPEPTDEQYQRIVAMESRTIPVLIDAKRHKLVTLAEKTLSRSKTDSRSILERGWDQQPCLDLRVTNKSLDRALIVADGIVKTLEAERFPVTVEKGKHSTTTLIFARSVPFAITEKVRETGRREVKEYSWTRTAIDYEGTGILEFRAGDYGSGRKLRDGKRGVLEDLIADCIGALMREARDQIHREEEARIREIEDRKRERIRAELCQQIAKEEEKVKEFEGWIDNWTRARQMRDFIADLEKVWAEANFDLSPEAPHGKRIAWMKQQAARRDPMLESPPSILDRKREASYRG